MRKWRLETKGAVATLMILLVSVVLHVLVGNLPLAIFSFPLNLIIAVVWLYILVELYRSRRAVAQYLLTPIASYISVILLVVGCMIMGLHSKPATTSLPFITLLFIVLSQLSMVIMRGWRNASGVRWRFLLNHVGLWLALVAGFWGAPDTDVLRAVVSADAPTDEAYYEDGRMALAGYAMQLVDFRAEYFDNGTPSSYEADVMIDNELVTLAVNRPYARSVVEDVYLTSYETHATGIHCILQIVRQPWKWVMFTGILMLIAGAFMMFIKGPQKRSV